MSFKPVPARQNLNESKFLNFGKISSNFFMPDGEIGLLIFCQNEGSEIGYGVLSEVQNEMIHNVKLFKGSD